MVLHHVKNIDFVLKEINRILKMNSFIIIREHDCITYCDKMIADIEHSLFYYNDSFKILKKNNIFIKKSNNTFRNNFYSKYYDIYEWDYIFDKYGFKLIDGKFISKTIYENITPSRSCIRLYKKIKSL